MKDHTFYMVKVSNIELKVYQFNLGKQKFTPRLCLSLQSTGCFPSTGFQKLANQVKVSF